jgi:hypothetical protein
MSLERRCRRKKITEIACRIAGNQRKPNADIQRRLKASNRAAKKTNDPTLTNSMKKVLLSLLCSSLMAAAAFGQSQSISLFNTGTNTSSGQFAPGSTFSLDTKVTFSGYTGVGLSYWLEVPLALAPYITITSEQYFTWTDPNQAGANTLFTDTSGADNANFRVDTRDLGGTASTGAQNQSAGTYPVSTLTFTLSPNAPNGNYTIQTTTITPRRSIVVDSAFSTHALPGTTYSITVVPEPSTIACLLGGAGILTANFIRRRRQS